MYARNSFKNKNILEENYQETPKKTNWFFPLHLVSFYGQDYELVTSLKAGFNFSKMICEFSLQK